MPDWGKSDRAVSWGANDRAVTPQQRKARADAEKRATSRETMGRAKGAQGLSQGVGVNPLAVGYNALRLFSPEATRAAGQGYSWNFSDEIAGLGAAVETGVGNLLGRNPGYSARDAYDATVSVERDRQRQFAREKPGQNIAAQVAGGAVNPLNALSGNYIGAGATPLAQTGRAVAVGAASGGMGGAGAGTDARSRATGAAVGAATGAAVSGALQTGGNALAQRAAQSAANPSPVRQLAAEGVRVTPGQAVGGVAKRAEDAMTSLPITGAAINQSRNTGLGDFNVATINRELGHIGQRLPQGSQAGRETFAEAWRLSGQAYDDALSGVTFTPDAQVQQSIAQVTANAPQTVRGQLQGLVDDVVGPRLNGPLDGQTWKQVDADLGKLVRSAENASQNTPGAGLLARALREVQLAWQGGLERAAPNAAQGVAAADRTRAGLERVRQALQNPATGAQDEMFTAAQLGRAAQQMDTSAGNRQFAQGQALMQDWAQVGQDVLPSRIGDSGTAGRLLIGGGVFGAGTTGNLDLALKVLAGDAALAGVHRVATVAVNRYLQATTPGQAQAVLSELAQQAARQPALMPIYRELVQLAAGQVERTPIATPAPQ